MGLRDDIARRFEGRLEKAKSIGLDYKDYREIKKDQSKLEKEGYSASQLYREMDRILSMMKNDGSSKIFSDSNRDYIKENSLLLPLALCDSDKEYTFGNDEDSVRLYIPREDEIITVSTAFNKYRTERNERYGIDILKYLENIRGKHYNDALELLCRIYGFKLPEDFNNKYLVNIAEKYREFMFDPGIDELLDRSEQSLYDRGYTNLSGKDIGMLYEQKRAILKRVREGLSDPNFKYDEPKKFIYR